LYSSGKFYYAQYPFEPGPNETTMMKVEKGQVLRVVQVILVNRARSSVRSR
jgi:hypothetical protein